MGGGSPSHTTTTSTNQLDPQVAAWTARNYATAQQVAGQKYSPYKGQVVAPLNSTEMAGINQGIGAARANTGLGAINLGIGNAAAAGAYDPTMVTTPEWDSTAAAKYMSPYTQQVIDAANTNIDRNLAQTTLGTNAAATAAGAYGGTRQAVQTAENQRDANALKASTAAGLLNDAYTNAQGAFSSDAARALAAGQSNQQAGLSAANLGLGSADLLGRLGISQQGVAQNNAQALLGYGQTLQDQQNAINQWNYQNNYLNPQQWPLRGLSALESAVSGIPYSSSGTQTTPLYHNQTAGALGGAASGAAIGSSFGPWGTAIGAVGGGLLGAFG